MRLSRDLVEKSLMKKLDEEQVPTMLQMINDYTFVELS